jgi:WD repeat and SOF domain-containing protein 1
LVCVNSQILQKIKALSRSEASTANGASQRNLDPALHPFDRAREYVRALNAAKLERMFAAPFVGQLGHGHQDGVYCLAKVSELD